MKKKIFKLILLLSIVFSIAGIYSVETKKTVFSFLNINTTGFFLTVVFLQGLYIYTTKEKTKEYAKIIGNCKTDRKSVKSNVRLGDVAGLEEVKEEVLEVVDFISSSHKYRKMGAKVPRGILFYGPPGTGKTLLASALAGETNAEFLYASGSEFIEKYVGVGAKRVRELFNRAREKAPCIVFIDEIDAIGGKRSNESQSEGNQTINQLLTEMDGFDKDDDKIVIVIGATNRLDILDAALLRPGRFDKHIYIGNPNKTAREQILRVHTRNKPLSEKVDLKSIAAKTHGLSGAHLANIANEAALLAVKSKRDVMTQEDFEAAIEKVVAGLKVKNSTVCQKEKKIISYHEAGHALVGKILNVYSIEKISIIQRGKALGYVLNSTKEDKYLYTRSDLLNKIKVLLGGRAAEEITFNDITTGARDDLHKATDIVLEMVCEYGMSNLGNRAFFGSMINENMLLINEEVKKIIDECYEETKKLLMENEDCLKSIAETIFENETITGQELSEIIARHKIQHFN